MNQQTNELRAVDVIFRNAKHRMRFVIVGMYCIAGSSCSEHRVHNPLTIDYVRNADPVKDAQDALASGQAKFVGVTELGEFVPGAENEPALVSRLGVNYVKGSSDTADKASEDAAVEYAEIFNRILVRQLRAGEQK